ncbi:hypothetical protein A2899_03480 [Candidatus Amesbacteria bacterium RIFCSPLOWO2_01_FULL_49_25]|uniref:protein O-GlcNAc transferase n=1 Tax=Candidatus Amesbacteria bacterium RIFCSPHIGHO2_01_FULL_48_32b TaxID=1797253 RepID=A0A1F4YGJ6_9BACT|nr:MAG: hypothetical protein A2876_02180 [Candidatus Amesbacteria bacterium RIFCSPHIGHO2_01_FULL_48_32b]OGD06932.1 MAG: hypothetical protein A2899_03480 [Candidatus Amesbacteria bacterium RIFCSPLOWO2_01_FULL_49_25]
MDNPQTLNNLGLKYYSLGNYPEAIRRFSHALSLDPDFAPAHNNLGTMYLNLGRYLPARDEFLNAIKLNPNIAEAHVNLAAIYKITKRYPDSEKHFLAALKINPQYAKALSSLGTLYHDQGKLTQAKDYYQKALKINPRDQQTQSFLYGLKREICDWDNLDTPSADTPFTNIVRCEDPKINFQVAKSWSDKIEKRQSFQKPAFVFKKAALTHPLRIGYVSNGFCDFPTGHNLVGVLENHSPRVQAFAFSYGPDDHSLYRKRIIKACRKFIDITQASHVQASQMIYDQNIDILVDLKGYTADNRIEIFTLRPAPIQVSYLGFPGTTGAGFMDYLIADKTVIPASARKYYSEKVIYLPDCYRATDNKAPISTQKFTPPRKDGIVFGSFNLPYKITPQVFTSWMNILKRVPNSILWQLHASASANKNLRAWAKKLGINPSRIIFTKNLPKPQHLARMKMANLMLDTHPVGGHTTTVDALWAGVPVITILGRHFASRVSASALSAIGLPKLITHSLKEYEDLAVRLATHPDELEIRNSKLKINKKSYPLFDTPGFTKHLEKVYFQIWREYAK